MTINKGLMLPLPYFTVNANLTKECVLRLTTYLDILTREAKANDDDVFLKSLSYFFNKWPDETIEKYSFTLYVTRAYVDTVDSWSKNRSIADAYIIGKEYMKRFNNLIEQLMVIIEDES